MNWKSPHSRALPSPSETPLIMGILNVGKYSFSDGGKYSEISSAVKHVEDMIAQGADIIDIGAESTRPNAVELSLDDEIEILLPRLKAVRNAFANIPISVDTYKPEVAKIAISEGADIINDVYAIRKEGRYLMAQVAAEVNAPLIVTHSCRDEIIDGNFFDFFVKGMQERIQSAEFEGVSSDMIIVDVGVGFGKTIEQNFELVRRLDEVKKMGYAVLLGVSRKSMFADIAGNSIDLRDNATDVVSAYCALKNNCDILRVHNVSANVVAIKTISKLI